MADKTIDVGTATSPWTSITSHARLGDLDGVLDITSEWGIAAGEDLSDETLPNLVFSDGTRRIQFRGEDEGCLTFDEPAQSGIHAPIDSALDFTVAGTLLLRMDADEGLSIWTASGDAILEFRRGGDSYSTEADIYGSGSLGIAADHHVSVFIDANDTSTEAAFFVSKHTDRIDDSQPLFYVREDVRVGVRYPDVVHGGTNHVAYTDTVLEILNDKDASTEPGGGVLIGIKDDTCAANEEGGCLQLRGYLEDDVMTGKNTTARSLVEAYGAQTSSGILQNVVANGNVFSVRAWVGSAWINCIIVDEDGDLYYRGALTAFDEEDDALALSDLYHILTGGAENVVRYDRAALETMGILGGGDDGLLSTHGATSLQLGAIRQINDRQKTLIGAANDARQAIADLDRRLTELEKGA